MRIITGKAKGTRLFTLEGENITRPTTERVKEAVFSMIQFEIEGRTVLDLFAGSGQLGLEAMSRGAESAMFVDTSREAMEIVKKNAEKTHFFKECRYLCSDYRSFLRKIAGKESYDIVFLDPPYGSEDLCGALERLAEGKAVKPTGVVVCESEKEDVFDGYDGLRERYRVRRNTGYGRVHITLLEPVYGEEAKE